MADAESDPAALDAETQITLGLLNAVAGSDAVTQRSVAKELGIALGLANAYLKRCVAKGYIKVTHAPANRYVYYLTPQGFLEKSRLTARYLSISFNFFREARRQCAAVFQVCAERRWRRVALWGAGDLVGIAVLCAGEFGIELVGVVAGRGEAVAPDLPVADGLAALAPIDAVVVTDLRDPQAAFEAAAAAMPRERVLTPAFLNVSRTPPRLME